MGWQDVKTQMSGMLRGGQEVTKEDLRREFDEKVGAAFGKIVVTLDGVLRGLFKEGWDKEGATAVATLAALDVLRTKMLGYMAKKGLDAPILDARAQELRPQLEATFKLVEKSGVPMPALTVGKGTVPPPSSLKGPNARLDTDRVGTLLLKKVAEITLSNKDKSLQEIITAIRTPPADPETPT